MTYSETIRKAALQKLAGPDSPGTSVVALEFGVDRSTLKRWRRQQLDQNPGDHMKQRKRPQNWTATERFEAVVETASMNEQEIGAFCRRKGIQTKHLTLWREACIASVKKGPKVDVEKKALREELEVARRDLARKDKALAETAVQLMIQKKMDQIWGTQESEDNT